MITRMYPFLSGCGTVANHPIVDWLAGRPQGDAWTEVEGGSLCVALNDYVGRAAFYVGDLDRKISVLIDRFVEPGDIVLDIGANIGLVSLRLSKRVGATGMVHAFEPNPTIADRLVSSLAANGISNVQLHRVALGETDGSLPLTVPPGNAGAASLLTETRHGNTVEVPVRRLDDFDLGQVTFIKMDVEGFEENVLRGSSKILASRPPRVIVFEQNGPNGDSIALLEEAGYRILGISRSMIKLTLRPVSAWSAAYHDYIAINHRW